MFAKKRLSISMLIFLTGCLIIGAAGISIFCHISVSEHKDSLTQISRSRADLLEIIFIHETSEGHSTPVARQNALRHVVAANHSQYSFGQTGEFVIAERKGDDIAFIFLHNMEITDRVEKTPVSSGLAIPMKLALEGRSGIVSSIDYKGTPVLAAYEPVAPLGIGIVAKMDMAEIRAPIIRSCMFMGGFLVTVMIAGVILITFVNHPVISKMEENSLALENEIERRNRYEKELRRSQGFYSTLLDNINEMVFYLDVNGRVVFANSYVEKHYNLSAETLTGIPMCFFWCGDSIDLVHDAIEEIRITGHSINMDCMCGTEFYQLRITPIFDITEMTGMICVAMRITERKKSEREIIEAKEMAEQYLNMAGTMLISLDMAGNILLLNRKGYEVLGYEEGTLTGKNWFDTCLPEEARQEVKQVFKLLVTGEIKAVENYENPIITKTGEERIIEWHNSISMEPDSKRFFFLSSGEDVTEKRVAEHEKDQLQLQLTQAQKVEAIGQLAGGMAHDFNNMLGVIMGYTSLLMEENEESPDTHKQLGYIMDAARRSKDLTSKLLTFSRKDKIETSPIKVKSLISEIVGILSRSIDKRVTIDCNIDNSFTVDVDRFQIQQALINICLNARDAMGNCGSIRIESIAECVSQSACSVCSTEITPGDYYTIRISDSGPGIPEEFVEKVFEPFFTTKGVGQGTGLGLSVTIGIIRNHGGHIRVYNKEEGGAVFEILLPVSKKASSQNNMLAPQGPINGHGTVLIVDDEPTLLLLTAKILAQKGYSVLQADNGIQAIDILRKNLATPGAERINVVILDMVMPEMDGLETLLLIREIAPDINILLTSGHSTSERTAQAISTGAAFIQKPYDISELTLKLSEVCHN